MQSLYCAMPLLWFYDIVVVDVLVRCKCCATLHDIVADLLRDVRVSERGRTFSVTTISTKEILNEALNASMDSPNFLKGYNKSVSRQCDQNMTTCLILKNVNCKCRISENLFNNKVKTT